MITKKVSFLILAVSVIIFLSDFFLKYRYSVDDTYIYLQYARNIAAGQGFSFNPGEPSYGITSIFWAILLSFSYMIGFKSLWFAKSLDLISAILSVIFFYK